MTGEKDLQILLSSMQPELHASEYVFCSLEPRAFSRLSISPLLVFREAEGVTLVLTVAQALEHDLPFEATWAWIELTVHSSLSAVGFLAAISRTLAQAGISLNVVSAYYHDHLFVPWVSRLLVMHLLQEMSAEYGER